MLNKYILIKIIVLFLMPNFILGQTDIKLSSLYLNPLTYNPAYAGSFEGMSFSSFYSSQWLGFDGAAKTIFVNGHGTVLGSNTGLGLELIRDEIGGSSETKILGNYAYHIKLNGNWRLSMGLKAGVSYSSVDYSKLNIENLNDLRIWEQKKPPEKSGDFLVAGTSLQTSIFELSIIVNQLIVLLYPNLN